MQLLFQSKPILASSECFVIRPAPSDWGGVTLHSSVTQYTAVFNEGALGVQGLVILVQELHSTRNSGPSPLLLITSHHLQKLPAHILINRPHYNFAEKKIISLWFAAAGG